MVKTAETEKILFNCSTLFCEPDDNSTQSPFYAIPVMRSMKSSPKSSSGLTLIELMISLAIGVIVLSSALGLVYTSAETRGMVKHSSELQEEAFFVTHTLKQQLAQTGYRGIIGGNPSSRSVPVATLTATYPAVASEWESGQVIKIADDTLHYRFDGASLADGTADGSVFDCLGNTIPQGSYQESEISLQGKKLICTVGTESIVLIGTDSGIEVEELDFTLGINNIDDNGVDRYIDASTATTADFMDTRHVTLNMLLASRDGVTRNNQTYQYRGVDTVATDNRLRLEVVVSVAIRN